MKRRFFEPTAPAGAVTAAAAGLSAPAIAQTQPKIRWRLVSSWPKNLDTIHAAAEQVSKRVSATTGGASEICVHGPGELVSAFGLPDAVQRCTVECARTALVFFGKEIKSPTVGVKTWEALPKERPQIFDAACAEAHTDMQAKCDSRNPPHSSDSWVSGCNCGLSLATWPMQPSRRLMNSMPNCPRRTRSERRSTPASRSSATTRSGDCASRTAHSTTAWHRR